MGTTFLEVLVESGLVVLGGAVVPAWFFWAMSTAFFSISICEAKSSSSISVCSLLMARMV